MLECVLRGVRATPNELELAFLEDGPWPSELAAGGFRVDVIRAGRLRQFHRWLTAVLRLARLIRGRRPDIVLNWSAKTQLYGAPAAALAGMADRVIWWQHSIPSRNWLDRCATALPAAAIGCSSNAAARAQARLAPARRTFVVAPGTPPPDIGGEPVALEVPPGVPVVGVVGRLQPWKGQDRMLEAQALLRERGRSMHMVIVGGDSYGLSADYAGSLSRLVSRLGLEDAVTMTGEVPDAGPYIEKMDILVNASDPEPFGIVLLEGMARGVPVVAVNSGGPAEFVENDTTGLLAPSGEPAALADALEPLLLSPALREALGRAGRERFLDNFTDAAMRARFFEQLERVRDHRLAKPGSRGR